MAKKSKKKKTGKNGFFKSKAFLITALVVVGVILIGLGGGILLGNSKSIHPGMTLGEVELGGMSKNEAAAALATEGWEDRDFGSVNVVLPANTEFTVSADEAGLTMSCEEAAAAAYDFGHSGNPVKDLISYFKCITGKATVSDLVDSGDNKALKKLVKKETKELSKLIKDGYLVDTDKETLSIVKGMGDNSLDIDKLCSLISEALVNGEESVNYEFTYAEDAKCDFDKLREEIFTEPVDASYDVKTEEIGKSVKGVDLDVNQANKLWKSAKTGELVVIPLEITVPKYNLEDFNGELFSDLLGTQTSNYASSSASRANNIELAASKINGVILNPGEEFSYNDTVGKRTEAAGFKPAGAYANGKTVNEVGGGICQVSSTLYCAALYANLEISARSCHYFPVNYLPSGLDATVSWGGPEFKFVNNRSFPIKIVATCSGRNLKVEIWGTDLDGSYVEMIHTQAGASGGLTADTYRNVYAKDGTLISSEHEAHSFYHNHTEEAEQSTAPEETDTPEESTAPEETTAPETTDAPAEPTSEPTTEPDPVTPIDIIEEFIDNTPLE